MAQQQHAADVHPDELCPPNKRYDLMDANKKVDLEHVQCPPESKILTNIIKNHPLRFSIAASSSVPWIYMAQFWHTLKEDGSKYRLRFMLDKKELSLTLDDFRTIFHLPQANDNNHNSFVPPPSFSDMVSFYKQQLGFTMELKTSSTFKTTGLLQTWQTLCKIFSKCLTTHVIGWDQPPLQIMQMMYCFVNNIHVDYAELLWEGIYYSLHHPTSSIPHKDKFGMQIPEWMITEEMKHTKHYRMYAEVFGLDVPLTQRSICLTPPVPVPTVEKVDEMILQDTLQVSLAEHKSREEQEARENVELFNKHLASEEIEKLVEGSENVIDDSLPPRNDETHIPGTRLEPRSDKESPEVERTNDEEVEVTKVVIPVNVNEEEDEITDEVYELKRREKGKIVEESRSTLLPTPIRSPRTHTNLKTSEYEAYVSGESSSGQVNEEERGPSTSGNQEQEDDYDFWIDSYASDDDEIPTKQVSQDIMEEVSLTIDEVKLKKMASKGNSAHHIQQARHQSVQVANKRDPEAPALSLIHQDLLYLKKGSSGPEKIILSLHKFLAIIFNDDDIEERTSRWVNKCVKKFNPYARYGVEHWKNPHAKIFYIRKQKEPGKPKEEIVARRANECIVSITEPDYKNLNKNDIEDMYLLIMMARFLLSRIMLLWSLSVFIKSSVIWERVHDFQLGIESYQQKVNLTAPTISFPGVEKHRMFFIIYEPVHGIIYKNSKKRERV
ncbi:hypothetical protein Tco_1437537 [Tanacetum coccineum]